MEPMCVVGVALVGVVVIAAVVWYVVRNRRRPRRLAYSTEEKALRQLIPLRDSLRSVARAQYSKSMRRYQKRLRVALAVYTFERYGITVRDTIHASAVDQASKGARGGHEALLRLKGLFDEANRLSETDHDPSEMLALYEQAAAFFSGSDATDRQAVASAE